MSVKGLKYAEIVESIIACNKEGIKRNLAEVIRNISPMTMTEVKYFFTSLFIAASKKNSVSVWLFFLTMPRIKHFEGVKRRPSLPGDQALDPDPLRWLEDWTWKSTPENCREQAEALGYYLRANPFNKSGYLCRDLKGFARMLKSGYGMQLEASIWLLERKYYALQSIEGREWLMQNC
jgi:hypothetical protein